MKQLYFIKWCLNGILENIKSWDRWMWGWMITCAWGPTAFLQREHYPNSFNYFIAFVLIFWFGYGVVYTNIKSAWIKFNDEQNKIIDHLSK